MRRVLASSRTSTHPRVPEPAGAAESRGGVAEYGGVVRSDGVSVLVVPTGDEVVAVAAAQRLGWIRSDQWPLVAAFLLAAGIEGDGIAMLAGLSRSASGWEVDQLVPVVLEEARAPALTVAAAADVLARILVRGVDDAGDHPLLRSLADLAPGLDYPGGRIGQAYWLSEWLDCECHVGSSERAAADAFEAELRALPPLRVDPALAAALSGGVITGAIARSLTEPARSGSLCDMIARAAA